MSGWDLVFWRFLDDFGMDGWVPRGWRLRILGDVFLVVCLAFCQVRWHSSATRLAVFYLDIVEIFLSLDQYNFLSSSESTIDLR